MDSGRVGFFDDDHLPAKVSDAPDFFMGQDYAVAPTFLGDGLYPVAVWATDGEPTAFAVLTDRRYFDPNWQT